MNIFKKSKKAIKEKRKAFEDYDGEVNVFLASSILALIIFLIPALLLLFNFSVFFQIIKYFGFIVVAIWFFYAVIKEKFVYDLLDLKDSIKYRYIFFYQVQIFLPLTIFLGLIFYYFIIYYSQ